MDKLKPCPCCKSDDITIEHDASRRFIYCNGCGIQTDSYIKEEEALMIKVWNTRAMELKNVVASYVSYNDSIMDLIRYIISDLSPLKDNGKIYTLTIQEEKDGC